MPAVTERAKRKVRVNRRGKELEKYIRELIRETKKSQSACAAELGMSQQNFSYLLKGMKFDAAQLILILDYLEADSKKVAEIIL